MSADVECGIGLQRVGMRSLVAQLGSEVCELKSELGCGLLLWFCRGFSERPRNFAWCIHYSLSIIVAKCIVP